MTAGFMYAKVANLILFFLSDPRLVSTLFRFYLVHILYILTLFLSTIERSLVLPVVRRFLHFIFTVLVKIDKIGKNITQNEMKTLMQDESLS